MISMDRSWQNLIDLEQEIDDLKGMPKPHSPGQMETFELWRGKVQRNLEKIYGSDSPQVVAFKRMGFVSPVMISGGTDAFYAKRENDAYQGGLSLSRAHLRGLIETDSEDDSINVEEDPEVTVFVSASFDDTDDEVIGWFLELIGSLGLSPDWLKRIAEPRPPEAKVKEHLKKADCLVQILTKDVEEMGKEKGWIGNEMAWSEEFHGPGLQAIFAEEGVRPTGIGREITETVSFTRNDLGKVSSKAVGFFLQLKANAIQKKSRG